MMIGAAAIVLTAIQIRMPHGVHSAIRIMIRIINHCRRSGNDALGVEAGGRKPEAGSWERGVKVGTVTSWRISRVVLN